MKTTGTPPLTATAPDANTEAPTQDVLSPLLQRPVPTAPYTAHAGGPAVGRLLAFVDAGATPLVALADRPGAAALPARSIVDLQAHQVGQEVLVVFENNDPQRPIITGVLRGQAGWPLAEQPGQVRVEADGRRLTVEARDELVLRCGKSVLVLHSDGRIELRGESILTQAAQTHRIRGGSVQLN